MTGGQTFRLRVTYCKLGRASMLSHLEITHAIERTIRRSKLPFALSQGFSPHMKLSFGSALPVGIGGTSETFDVILTEYIPDNVALESLVAASAQSLPIASCSYIDNKASSASVSHPYSIYEVCYTSQLDNISIPDTIDVIRKKKTKTLSVNDYLVGDILVVGDIVRFQLVSSNSGSLRPDVLLSNSTITADNPACAYDKIPTIKSVTRIVQSETPIEDLLSV